jgi:hypothetical protein
MGNNQPNTNLVRSDRVVTVTPGAALMPGLTGGQICLCDRMEQVTMARETELLTARADALFTSDLSARGCHSQAEIAAAIIRAIRSHSAAGGCAAEVAAAYGEHPETAAPRMRWARAAAQRISSPAAASPVADRKQGRHIPVAGGVHR